jgi:hypothetical protein
MASRCWRVSAPTGHFVREEAPDLVTAALLDFLD